MERAKGTKESISDNVTRQRYVSIGMYSNEIDDAPTRLQSTSVRM